MNHQQANDLVERYFAGETSREEEARLKAYFRTGAVSPELEVYRPLFAYWAEEATVVAPPRHGGRRVRRLPRILLAVAASLLLVVLVRFVHQREAPAVGSFPVAQRAPVDWSKHEITDEEEALRFLKTVLKSTSENLTRAPEITIRELREVERILD